MTSFSERQHDRFQFTLDEVCWMANRHFNGMDVQKIAFILDKDQRAVERILSKSLDANPTRNLYSLLQRYYNYKKEKNLELF